MISYSLAWVAVVMTVQGFLPIPIPERTTFKDEAACMAFGAERHERVGDWLRGHLRLDWDAEIIVGFECKPVGDPA